MLVAVADENRHRPDGTASWGETWHLDFFDAHARLGGFVRLRLLAGGAEYWACLAGETREAVVVIDHHLATPRSGLELRGSGVWTELACLVPLEHFTVQLEAFGVVADAGAVIHDESRGSRVPLGCDLEWESEPADAIAIEGGYAVPAAVHGEIRVGDERIDFDGYGVRRHTWGIEDALPGWRAWARAPGGDWRLGTPIDRSARAAVAELNIADGVRDSIVTRVLTRLPEAGGGEPATGWIECSQYLKDS